MDCWTSEACRSKDCGEDAGRLVPKKRCGCAPRNVSGAANRLEALKLARVGTTGRFPVISRASRNDPGSMPLGAMRPLPKCSAGTDEMGEEVMRRPKFLVQLCAPLDVGLEADDSRAADFGQLGVSGRSIGVVERAHVDDLDRSEGRHDIVEAESWHASFYADRPRTVHRTWSGVEAGITDELVPQQDTANLCWAIV